MSLGHYWQQKRIRVSIKVAVAGAALACLYAPAGEVPQWFVALLALAIGAVGFFVGGMARGSIGRPGAGGYVRTMVAGLIMALFAAAAVGLVLAPPIGLVFGPIALLGFMIDPLNLIGFILVGTTIHATERRWPNEQPAPD